MNRYLNANPAHTEFLDMARLEGNRPVVTALWS